jgi:hypothetical protein
MKSGWKLTGVSEVLTALVALMMEGINTFETSVSFYLTATFQRA